MSKQAKRERQRQNKLARREAQEQWLKRRKTIRTARNILIPLGLVLAIAIGWNILRSDDGDSASDTTSTTAAADLPDGCMLDAAPPMELVDGAAYAATVETSEGTFEMSLDSAQAPQTVNSFVYSARNGCYDGTTFHRVAETQTGDAFVIQGGDPLGDGTGDFGYMLPDEPPVDGYDAGMVAMANAGPGTTGSQFFVVMSDGAATTLEASGGPPFAYSVLGQITEGFEVAETIFGFVPPEGDGPPTQPIEIISITVTQDGELLGPTVAATDDTVTPIDTGTPPESEAPEPEGESTPPGPATPSDEDPATPPEEE